MKGFTLLEILILICIIGILITLGLTTYNSAFIDTQQYRAVVVDKDFQPERTTITTHYDSNNRPYTSSTYHPPQWRVLVSIELNKTSCSTTAGIYDAVALGQWVKVEAGTGRIFKRSYVCKHIGVEI